MSYIRVINRMVEKEKIRMHYGYARVSTKGQQKDGSSLEAQEKLLREAGAMQVYSDGFTGMKASRPELHKLLSILREGDTITVTKLDRIARSLSQGSALVNELLERGVRINILNIGMMDNTPASKLIRNIFFAFAEFERDMILERTQEGKAIARQDPNYREGRRPVYGKAQMELAMQLLETHTYRQVEEMTGMSKSTLVRGRRKVNNGFYYGD